MSTAIVGGGSHPRPGEISLAHHGVLFLDELAVGRVEAVRKYRLSSHSTPTQKLAQTPTRFHVENIPHKPFLLIPKVSSERRAYIPVGFMNPDTLVSDLMFIAPKATLYHFGVVSSTMHMAWVRAVCGRLESRYRYSAGIVYNNFPWPEPSERQRVAIDVAVQTVLDARAKHPTSTLADLYDPNATPAELVRAHQALDKAVDVAYGKTTFGSEADRVAFLFERYEKLTSLLPTAKTVNRTKRRTRSA